MKIKIPFIRRGSKTTDPVFVDLTSDFGFKTILANEANKDVLLELLRQLVPDEDIAKIEHIDKEKKARTKAGKSVAFDVYCKTADGKRIIIEMQNKSQKFFLSRSIFYSTFAVQDQLKRGLKDYDFAPVYMISFVCEDIPEFKGRTNIITRVNLCTREDNLFVADNLNYIYIELKKFTKTEADLSAEDVLDGLLYSIKNMATLKAMPQKLRTPLFQRLYEASRFAAMNALEQYKYIKKMTTKEDIKAQMHWEREQGREEGREGERHKIVNNMSAHGLSEDEIAKCIGVSLEEVRRLLNHESELK